MKYELYMECRAGTRHAFKTVMIIKLLDGTFKLHKVCGQCKSEKFPIWSAKGVILKSPAYRYSQQYREFLNDHNPLEARAAILDSDIKKVEAPRVTTNNPGVRQVHQTKKRHRNVKSKQRPRNKRYAGA